MFLTGWFGNISDLYTIYTTCVQHRTATIKPFFYLSVCNSGCSIVPCGIWTPAYAWYNVYQKVRLTNRRDRDGISHQMCVSSPFQASLVNSSFFGGFSQYL